METPFIPCATTTVRLLPWMLQATIQKLPGSFSLHRMDETRIYGGSSPEALTQQSKRITETQLTNGSGDARQALATQDRLQRG